MTIKQTPYDLLRQASDIISERGENYGGIEDNFQLISDLASLRLGRDIHPYEVAIIMVCVKNARAFSTPDHLDSHVDAMNYEAFAATFAQDYLHQKSESGSADISYKKRTDLKPANIAKFTIPKPSATAIKGVTPPMGKSSPSISINLDELADEIIEKEGA